MKPSNSSLSLPKVQVNPKKVFKAKRISQEKPTQTASNKHVPADNAQAGPSRTSSQAQSTVGKKRKIIAVDGARDREPDSDLQAPTGKRTFSYLKKHVKRLPQEIVKKHWKALPLPAQQQVRELFQTAKRSVMHGAKDERRAREIEAALGTVLRRLEKQLPRMPFPPRAKEWMFNLDRVVERNRKLEAELTPALDSCKLLEEAIEEEERLLERDKAALEDLKKDVKYEENRRAKESRAILPFFREGDNDERSMASDEESVRLATPEPRINWEEVGDSELQLLVKQFKNHLGSLVANKVQVEGLDQAIRMADMALLKVEPGA